MTTRWRSSRRSPRRHCARAECSESTGISRSGSPLTRSMISSPPTTSALLVRQRQDLARLQRGQRRREPDGPDHGVQHHVGLRVAGQRLGRVRARRGPRPPACRRAGACSSCRRLLVRHRHERRHELADLADQQVLVRAGGQPDAPGSGRGCAARRRAPGCRSNRSSRGSPSERMVRRLPWCPRSDAEHRSTSARSGATPKMRRRK